MAIAVDQANLGNFAQDSALSSIPFTTTAAVASSGFIVVTVTWFGTATLSSVSGGGLTWAIDKSGIGGSGNVAKVSAQAPSGLASGTTITATLSGSSAGGNSICGSSYTGVATSAPVDTTDSHANSNANAAWTTNSITVLAGSLIEAGSNNFNTYATSTPTSPTIELQDFGISPTHFAVTTDYRIASTAGSYTLAGTWTANNGDGVTTAVAYKVGSGGSTKSIVTAAINATSAVTGAIQKLAAIKPASVSATSAVTGSVAKLVHLVTASISSTSAVTGSVAALRAVKPAAISATSAVSATVTKLGTKVIVPAAISATSVVTGGLQALRPLVAASISATSAVTGAITGGASSAAENVRDFFAAVFHYHGH